jgi:hypothetical protein
MRCLLFSITGRDLSIVCVIDLPIEWIVVPGTLHLRQIERSVRTQFLSTERKQEIASEMEKIPINIECTSEVQLKNYLTRSPASKLSNAVSGTIHLEQIEASVSIPDRDCRSSRRWLDQSIGVNDQRHAVSCELLTKPTLLRNPGNIVPFLIRRQSGTPCTNQCKTTLHFSSLRAEDTPLVRLS